MEMESRRDPSLIHELQGKRREEEIHQGMRRLVLEENRTRHTLMFSLSFYHEMRGRKRKRILTLESSSKFIWESLAKSGKQSV